MPATRMNGQYDDRDVKRLRAGFNGNNAMTVDEAIAQLEQVRHNFGGDTLIMCEGFPVSKLVVLPHAEDAPADEREIVDVQVDMRVRSEPGYDHENDCARR